MTLPETHFVDLSGGRRIAYCAYGDPRGRPVFYFHGTPGSRYEPMRVDATAKASGQRVLALDRPGIGQSSYVKGRRLLDWPADTEAVAHALGLDTFAVIGASGGGPYALACAFAIPKRLTSVTVMGSWAPVAADPELWHAISPPSATRSTLTGRLPGRSCAVSPVRAISS